MKSFSNLKLFIINTLMMKHNPIKLFHFNLIQDKFLLFNHIKYMFTFILYFLIYICNIY